MATDLVGYTDVTSTGVRVHCPWGDGADPVVVFGTDAPIRLAGRGIYVSAEAVNGVEWAVTAPQDNGDQAWLVSRAGTPIGLGPVNGQYPVQITRAGRVFTMPAFGEHDPRNGTIRREFDLTGRHIADVGVPRTSQGFAGVGADGEPLWMVPGVQTIGGLAVNRPYWDGDFMSCQDNHAERLLGYHAPTATWRVVANVRSSIGARVRMVGGSAVFAISLPGLWVPWEQAATYTPPPVTIPTFPAQQASVLVIGDHLAPETIAVIDRPGDPRDAHTRGVFATEFANDLALGAAQAASLNVPLYVYRDRAVYGPDPIYTQPGVTILPTLRCYPERVNGDWTTPAARIDAVEPQVTAAEHAGYRGQIAMVLPVYTGSGAWSVEHAVALIKECATRLAGRIRVYVLFEQERGATDGIAHVPAFAQTAANLKAACALPAPVAIHQPAPPKDDPSPAQPPAPPTNEETPVPDTPSVPPPPPTTEEQLAAYHSPADKNPGPGYVWMAGHWNYYGIGATSAAASMAANAAAQSATPTPTPIVPPITQRVHVDGPIFRADDGQPWQWRGASAFVLPMRWCQGDDIASVLAELRALGVNTLRCFLQHKFMLWPQIVEWITPIDRVRPFVDYLATQGFRVELTILADCEDDTGDGYTGFNQSHDWQVSRVRDVLAAVASAPNVVIEIGNEPPNNGCDVERIAQDLGLFDAANRPVPMALGLYPITGSEPDFPVLDYVTDHPERKPDWTVEAGKTGDYVYRQTGRPWVADEWAKFSSPDNPDGEATECDPVQSPRRAEEGGAGCALSGAGFTFHSVSGIHASLLTPLERECCQRAMAAMALIPADAATGDYTHDGMGNSPLAKVTDTSSVAEVAGRVRGNTAIEVGAMPTTWNPVCQNDWRIVRRELEIGQLIFLER
jgi:hypothetical protein